MCTSADLINRARRTRRGSPPRGDRADRGQGARTHTGPSGPSGDDVAALSFSSTKMTWVAVSPMFSPPCRCAGSQPVRPAGMSTSRCVPPEWSRLRKALRVYRTLSGARGGSSCRRGRRGSPGRAHDRSRRSPSSESGCSPRDLGSSGDYRAGNRDPLPDQPVVGSGRYLASPAAEADLSGAMCQKPAVPHAVARRCWTAPIATSRRGSPDRSRPAWSGGCGRLTSANTRLSAEVPWLADHLLVEVEWALAGEVDQATGAADREVAVAHRDRRLRAVDYSGRGDSR